jgi:beta-lactamase superfamily II metal-dependent hydrolase
MRSSLLSFFLILSAACHAQAKSLEIYFVDVEGGQATLVVAPSGQTLLVDAGWPEFEGRDADRILAAAREAGVRCIDYLLVTHYHRDHVGGVPQLAAKIPIGTFLDHGPSVESGERADALMAEYRSLAEKASRRTVRPGDKIPIRGLDVTVLASAGEVIRSPLAGAGQANALCAETRRMEEAQGENPQSVGILIRYGEFRMINLGDLTWNKELDLVCPVNCVGKVAVYLTTHHANADSGSAAIVHALAPRVAIMNNGARKGGVPEAWQVMRRSPGLEDIWQLHRSIEGGHDHNAAEQFIANPEEKCEGRTIKLVANKGGSFTVTNRRNDFSKRYNPRPRR